LKNASLYLVAGVVMDVALGSPNFKGVVLL
jgi:hypothetical protein